MFLDDFQYGDGVSFPLVFGMVLFTNYTFFGRERDGGLSCLMAIGGSDLLLD